MPNQKQKVKTVKLRDLKFPSEVFVPLKSGKFVDKVISKKGGTMPATITVVVGEPGSGKTTMLVDKLSGIQEENPEKRCLYVSSEMNPIDNMELAEELPQLMDIEGFYLADYDDPKGAIEDILEEGWDYVIMDSFMDVKDKIKDSDGCKMSATAVETWLISLLVKNTKGQNKLKKYTAFDVIQHITKGGTYAGSTKLKHNTTAMVFIRIDQQTRERYLVYTKNRRGDIGKRLYMTLTEKGLGYNEKKYNDLERAIRLQKEMDAYNEDGEGRLMDLLKGRDEEEEKKVIKNELKIDLGDSEGVIDRDSVNIANSLSEVEGKNDENKFIKEVIEYVSKEETMGVPQLRHKFRLSYRDGVELINSLEEMGVVGTDRGRRPRIVLLKNGDLEEFLVTRGLKNEVTV
jgi:KaiC/GvpD/RAD55 family RecA-like ATPase